MKDYGGGTEYKEGSIEYKERDRRKQNYEQTYSALSSTDYAHFHSVSTHSIL